MSSAPWSVSTVLWDRSRRVPPRPLIGVLPGEGVGQEVVGVALEVLDALSEGTGQTFELRTGGLIGLPAQRASGHTLTEEVIQFCADVFAEGGAILCGPGGGRFVYELRRCFDLYCKVTPLLPVGALADAGPLRSEHVTGTDILVVRENTAGLYFGEASDERTASGARMVTQRVSYDADQVDRIARVAASLAASRRGRLAVALKLSGVPALSALWAERVRALTAGGGVDVEILEVDHAAYRLIADPRRFDVVLAPNAFGDILGDVGALLLASRGMSHSGNFAASGASVYQTGHGSALDLVGLDRANPVGQLRALGMLLAQSFGLRELERAIESAIEHVLAAGYRTPDVATSSSTVVGTRELGRRIAAEAKRALTATGAAR